MKQPIQSARLAASVLLTWVCTADAFAAGKPPATAPQVLKAADEEGKP